MTSVGQQILCLLDSQQRGADVCCVKQLNVRVFVLERLSAAAEFMCNLFQREIDTLETLLEKKKHCWALTFIWTLIYTLQVYLLHTQQQTTHCRYDAAFALQPACQRTSHMVSRWAKLYGPHVSNVSAAASTSVPTAMPMQAISSFYLALRWAPTSHVYVRPRRVLTGFAHAGFNWVLPGP